MSKYLKEIKYTQYIQITYIDIMNFEHSLYTKHFVRKNVILVIS